MREILMFKINSQDFAVSKLKRKLLSGCADMFEIPSLVRYIGVLTDCISSFKTFSSQRVLCECAIIKLTTPQVNTDFNSLLSRIDSLENKLAYMQSNSQVVVQSKQDTAVTDKISEVTDDIPLPPEPPMDDDFNLPVESATAKTVVSDGAASKAVANWNDIMTAITAKGQLRVFTALFLLK